MEKYFVIAALLLDFAESVSLYGPVWTYDDEGAWPGGFCKKGGKRQSPIDIQTNIVVKDFEKQFIKYGGLKFIGYENVMLTGVNNGHTIQFSTEGEKTMHPTLTGGPLKYLYRLEQLHFHWLSEHSIDGVKYPMEIHFVHVRADLKVTEALSKRDGLAIIAVFCNVQADLSKHQKEASEEIMEHVSQLMRTGDRISGAVLNIRKLLSPKVNSYFSYLGSLTSPECNEVVVWIIFDKPIYISDADYRLFGKVGIGRHNFRSLQKQSHHLVFQPPDPFISTPYAVQVLADVIKLVKDFFSNATRYPMEIHFVHVRADLKVTEALSKRDGLAIIAVFCNVQANLSKHQKEASEEIMEHVSQLMRTGDRISGAVLNIRKLLSPKVNSYFSYLGSLTSPECNEVVVWIIFDKPIYISDADYRLFGKVGIGRHNFRSLQKQSHHLVFQPPDPFISTPYAVQVLADVIKLVKDFFSNATRVLISGLKNS